ncbi:hypothetical protein HBB16_20340 [Pseudonocardia sp. MCCB 268]|nr:hypothetical protein [Pseudonocardia cytotoxica]
MCLLLNAARRTSAGERELRAGDWTGWQPTHHAHGADVSGKHLRIIGMGRISAAVARRAVRLRHARLGTARTGPRTGHRGRPGRCPRPHRADSIRTSWRRSTS